MSGAFASTAKSFSRLPRYALEVIRRAVGRVAQAVGTRRVIVTADRGVADVALLTLLNALEVTCMLRVQAGTTVYLQRQWCTLGPRKFRGNARHRSFGALASCQRCPPHPLLHT